jgi:hypothetical protein
VHPRYRRANATQIGATIESSRPTPARLSADDNAISASAWSGLRSGAPEGSRSAARRPGVQIGARRSMAITEQTKIVTSEHRGQQEE